MFGIGISELVLIAIVALVVVGPKNLPGALRAIGRAIGEFRRTTRELRDDVGFDQVVNEVTRPLREGMAGVQAEAAKLKSGITDLGSDVKRDEPGVAMANEYPEGGPDDYGALPETAGAYPDRAPVYSKDHAEIAEKRVPRNAPDGNEDG